MRRLVAFVLCLVGCSGSSTVAEGLAAPPGQDAGSVTMADAATSLPDKGPASSDAGVDVDTRPDASSSQVDAGTDTESPDGDMADVSPIVDSSSDAADSAPDHVGSVWCVTGSGLFVGCDGKKHTFTMTTPSETCPAGASAIATCDVGASCSVIPGGSGTPILGTCE